MPIPKRRGGRMGIARALPILRTWQPARLILGPTTDSGRLARRPTKHRRGLRQLRGI
jgi:hypothetical protein